MTLFGRDSLLTAWMALHRRPDARARACSRRWPGFQGDRRRTRDRGGAGQDPPRDPLRRPARACAWPAATVYYGSIDATPLFVMLLGELRRWGLADDVVDELLPHADRALDWIDDVRRPRRRRLRRVPARDRPAASPTRAGRTRGTRSASPTATLRRDARSRLRGAGLRVRRVPGPRRTSRDEAGDAATPSALPGQGRRAAERVQPGLLARRTRAGTRSASTPTSARSTRWRRTWATACGPASSTRGRAAVVADALMSPEMFSRLGHPHAGVVDGGVQPGQLPQRLGLAPRQRDQRRRPDALRLRRRGPPRHRRPARRRRRTTAAACPSCSPGSPATRCPVPAVYPTSCSPQAWAAASPAAVAAPAPARRPVGRRTTASGSTRSCRPASAGSALPASAWLGASSPSPSTATDATSTEPPVSG